MGHTQLSYIKSRATRQRNRGFTRITVDVEDIEALFAEIVRLRRREQTLARLIAKAPPAKTWPVTAVREWVYDELKTNNHRLRRWWQKVHAAMEPEC